MYPSSVQTITGQGFDCHMLCLREVSQELGMPLPAIFADESYAISNRFPLSTSQVKLWPSSHMQFRVRQGLRNNDFPSFCHPAILVGDSVLEILAIFTLFSIL